jgi:type VI secretion system protein ImpL
MNVRPWQAISAALTRPRRRRASASIASAVVSGGDPDEVFLREKLQDALARAEMKWGATYLYDVPWHVLVGRPGAGIAAAVRRSGLQDPEQFAGVGAMRYCEWWFTKEMVLIDLRGSQSDIFSHQRNWIELLHVLKANRPRLPVGAIVVFSVDELISLQPSDLSTHCDAIRKLLLKVGEGAAAKLPVHVLFTKCDLVAGFMEFFARLAEPQRRRAWGVSLRSDTTRDLAQDISVGFDRLIAALNYDLDGRREKRVVSNEAVLLNNFPAQMAALKQPVSKFLLAVVGQTSSSLECRGFNFSSACQHGSPIDLIGASRVRESTSPYRVQSPFDVDLGNSGSSFFLADLFKSYATISTTADVAREAV